MQPEPATPPDVSIIICTRDRPGPLRHCLATLRIADEMCGTLQVEVLVIENGSAASCLLTDGDLSTVGPPATRLLRMVGGNLSMARNHGMANARGALLAFVDDDCLVAPSWLMDIERHWRAAQADFLMGGRVRLADPLDLPFTIKDVDEAQVFHPGVHPGGFVQGCNFIVPRTTAERIGPFDVRFGAGGHFRAGEDTDFIIRAHGLGIGIHYVPDMVVLHRHGRRSRAEIERLNSAYAHANGAILAKHVFRHPWLARHLAWTLRSTLQERIGGPLFDESIGLAWASVVRDQLRGIAAFVRTVFLKTGGHP